MCKLSAFLLVIAIAAGVHATANGAGEIKQRMRDRLGTITSLKTAKTVGEDNKGYLHILGDVDATGRATVEAENADRRQVYTAIGAKTGATAAAVGQTRAASIAQSAAAGVMLQAPDGGWYEKR